MLKFVIFCFLILSNSCQSKKNISTNSIAVDTAFPRVDQLMIWDDYKSRLESQAIAEVRARVSGIIVEAPYEEGSIVSKDTLLFVLDQRPFEAELLSMSASFDREKALASRKKAQLKRYEQLKAENAISSEEFEQIETEFKEAKANLEVSKAKLDIAKLNLDWSKVYSPISGVVGKKLITVGNLVNGSSADSSVLTTVNSIDPMYVFLDVPESKFLKYRSLSKEYPEGLPCRVNFVGNVKLPVEGKIDFFDNHVSSETGTVQLRCVISNKSGELISGLQVDAQVLLSSKAQLTLIPNVSILTDQTQKYILLVDDENKIVRKDVRLGRVFGKFTAIFEELNPKSRILISGLQKVKLGDVVLVNQIEIEKLPVNN